LQIKVNAHMSYFWSGHHNLQPESFNDEELELNLHGKMSTAQQKKVSNALSTELRVNFFGMFFAIVFLVGSWAYGIFQMYKDVNTLMQSEAFPLVGGSFAFVFSVAVLGLVYQTWIKPMIKKFGQVKSVSGQVKKTIWDTETATMWYIKVGKTSFPVNPNFQEQFLDGEHWTFFYTETPNSLILLSYRKG
jgi:hypothetical protein